jgi:uncharacterized membrane protein
MLRKQHRPKASGDRHADDRSDGSATERINTFSDGVFAVIITIKVLDLKKPPAADWHSLFSLWPVLISYIVSYLFIAIVWVNHHYLLRHAQQATMRLIWTNFAHLFSVSFIPFLTAWIADTRFESIPVAMYALVFLLVNITYLILAWECLFEATGDAIPERVRRLLHIRSFTTIGLFAIALVISFWWPLAGFIIICACLFLYLRPEAPRTVPRTAPALSGKERGE